LQGLCNGAGYRLLHFSHFGFFSVLFGHALKKCFLKLTHRTRRLGRFPNC
jgi:hypothetical protein